MQSLEKADRIARTCDAWTPVTTEAYVTRTADFIIKCWKFWPSSFAPPANEMRLILDHYKYFALKVASTVRKKYPIYKKRCIDNCFIITL